MIHIIDLAKLKIFGIYYYASVPLSFKFFPQMSHQTTDPEPFSNPGSSGDISGFYPNHELGFQIAYALVKAFGFIESK